MAEKQNNNEPDNVVDFEEFKKQFLAKTEGTDSLDLVRALSAMAPAHEQQGRRPLTLPIPPTTAMRYRVRIDLVGAEPPIWRQVTLPGNLTLDRVHDAIQVAFDWTDSHLHRFTPTDDRYGNETEPIVTQADIDEGEVGVLESGVRLDQLLERVGDSIHYTYDFGDDWEHRIVVESVDPLDPADRAIRCLSGHREAPPEDVGGLAWYEHLLEIAADAHHPEFANLRDQVAALGLSSSAAAAPEPDLDTINRGLNRLEGADETLAWLRAAGSPLAHLIAGVNPEAQRHIAGFVTDARLAEPVEVTDVEATRSTAVIRTFLSHVAQGDEGIQLTSAGYLPPAVVIAMMADLDPEKLWFGTATRETQTQPLLALRETATTLGLVRKNRGRLALTKRGASLRNAPMELWHYLAERLPVERSQHGRDIGILLLLLVAAGDEEAPEELDITLEQMAMIVGWRFEGGSPYGPSDAMRSVSDTRKVLVWAANGTLLQRGLPSSDLTAPESRQLARAALTR